MQVNRGSTDYPSATLSDQIASRLSELARISGLRSAVENFGSQIETYRYGNESARLIKRLVDSSVGEDGGKIIYFAEKSDFTRFDWWKTVLDKLPVTFLEFPVEHVILDGTLEHPEFYFSPKVVTEHYNLNPSHNQDRDIACLQWVQDLVIDTLNPLLNPDFKVLFYEDHFRLIPLAQRVTLEDSATCEKVKEKIIKAAEILQQAYQKMAVGLRNK